MATHARPVFRAAPRAGCDGVRVDVAIIGAGPVGLTLAIDLAQRGIDVALLDDDDTVSDGSRAICWSQRTLQIFDSLGIGDAVAARGVRWNTGRVFFGDAQVHAFDLAPEPGHRRPAFVNLQQHLVEAMLVERAQALASLQLRWKHRCAAVQPTADGVNVQADSPEGAYTFSCDWLVACDGAHSGVRESLGLRQRGQVFRERFLIADVRMRSPFPAERWFWFDPPFHRNQSALLHRQADDVWRLDFQLGEDADAEAESAPARVASRVQAMLGIDARFDIEWASVYTFSCRRLDQFRHGRVLFAGDAAHVVSPFGARGANSGVEDAYNLGWKLARVVRRQSPPSLLDSYDTERCDAADVNILQSTRATEFITPKTAMSRRFRDAVLTLARRHSFARQWINSGRLSVAATLVRSPLNAPESGDAGDWHGIGAGAAAVDAPLAGGADTWLAAHLGGRFVLLAFGADVGAADAELLRDVHDCEVIAIRMCISATPEPAGAVRAATAPAAGVADGALRDVEGMAARRYDARAGTCYLVRPDLHVCARWRAFDRAAVCAAIARATGRQSNDGNA